MLIGLKSLTGVRFTFHASRCDTQIELTASSALDSQLANDAQRDNERASLANVRAKRTKFRKCLRMRSTIWNHRHCVIAASLLQAQTTRLPTTSARC